jgi:hypothetical protein
MLQHRRKPWRNFGGNLSFTPELVFYPRTREDLVAIVRRARRQGKQVRVVGRGHSWTPLVPVEDYLVDTRYLTRIGPIDPQRRLVTLECGVSIGALDAALRAHDLALPSNVVLTSVTYGGVLATGCHGAGKDCQTLSDLVEAMTIVLASGEVVTFTEATHGAEVMNAVRLNLGLLGIMHEITLRVEPLFNLRSADRRLDLGLVREPARLKEFALGHEAIEVFWMPFAASLWAKTWDRTVQPARRRPHYTRPWQWVQMQFFRGCGALLKRMPRLTPALARLFAWLVVPWDREVVLEAPDALHYNSSIELVPTDVASFAVRAGTDFANVVAAWQVMVKAIEERARRGVYPVNICLELRVVRNSRALLSPSWGAEDEYHCYFEIVSFAGTPGYEEAIATIGQAWMAMPGLGARPHWAKGCHRVPGLTPYMHRVWGAQIACFARLRERLDPEGMFLNTYLAEVFGGASAVIVENRTVDAEAAVTVP